MNHDLKTRLISGVIAGTLFLIVISYRTGFIIVFLLLGLIGLYEMQKILKKAKLPKGWLAPILFSNIWALIRAISYALKPQEGILTVGQFAIVTGLLYLLTSIFVLSKTRLKTHSQLALATFAWPGWSFALMIMYITADGLHKFPLFLGILLLIWSSDITQYFTGRKWGRRPLAKSISPKKTIEGWLGGLAGVTVISLLNATWVYPTIPLMTWLCIGLVIWIFGTAGDLYESVLKRSVGVKDSGTILPGHGGILDRFDSLVFAFPFVVIILTIWP